jgi:hypothetical protein
MFLQTHLLLAGYGSEFSTNGCEDVYHSWGLCNESGVDQDLDPCWVSLVGGEEKSHWRNQIVQMVRRSPQV